LSRKPTSTETPSVLLVQQLKQDGGAEKILSLLFCGLTSKGFSCERFVFHDQAPRLIGAAPRFSVFVRLQRLLSLIAAIRTRDVIIVSLPMLTFVCAVSCALYKKRLIVRVANSYSEQSKNSLYLKLLSLVNRSFSHRVATDIVANSNTLAEELYCYAGKEKVSIIYNPAPHPVGLDNARSAKSEKKKLLVVGRLAPQKRVDLILKAFATSHLRQHCTVDIIGTGPCEKGLLALAKDLGITHCVSFKGWQDDVQSYYLRADALLFGSKYEGCPNVLLEALAYGVPVVTTPLRGIAHEIIINRKTGLITAEESIDAYAQSLNEVFDISWSLNNFSSQSKKFSQDIFFESYVNIILRCNR
jgi:glycosyltransferase involved in cell wall biosynthesis